MYCCKSSRNNNNEEITANNLYEIMAGFGSSGSGAS